MRLWGRWSCLRRGLRRFRPLVGVRLCIARLTTVCLFFLSFSRLPLLTFEPTVRLVATPPWFSLFFTFIAAVVLLKAGKVARAAAILNANLETSDKKAKSEASDEREIESCLEKVDVS